MSPRKPEARVDEYPTYTIDKPAQWREQREVDYQAELQRCTCKRPIRGSVYLGRTSCVACGRFV